MDSVPVRVIPVHDHLRPRLVELYESDSIFDKFEVSASADGTRVMTGSYNNSFKVYDVQHGSETSVELNKARPKPTVVRRIAATAVGLGTVARSVTAMEAERTLASYSLAPLARTTSDDVDMLGGAGGGGAVANAPGGVDQPQPPLPLGWSVEPEYDGPPGGGGGGAEEELDATRKVLHFCYHPHDDIVAVAGINNLYIYHT
jgi:serine/threonine-protein phosphatase 2A regulatory subunit B